MPSHTRNDSPLVETDSFQSPPGSPSFLRRQKSRHIFFGKRRCVIFVGFMVLAAAVVVASVVLVFVNEAYLDRSVGPDVGPADGGAFGYNVSDAPDAVVGPAGAWCQVAAPHANWSLTRDCPTAASASMEVRVMTYSTDWESLFRERSGAGGISGKLIADAGESVPFDFIGFQDCQNVERLLIDADYGATYGSIHNSEAAISIAYDVSKWTMVSRGSAEVAQDDTGDERRAMIWARLQHIDKKQFVFFASHTGPVPTGSGGSCGPLATAYNLMRVIGFHAHPGDAIFLVGDFEAGSASVTSTTAGQYMDLAFAGDKFDGADQIFSACAQISGEGENLGGGGSDHDALSATFSIR